MRRGTRLPVWIVGLVLGALFLDGCKAGANLKKVATVIAIAQRKAAPAETAIAKGRAVATSVAYSHQGPDRTYVSGITPALTGMSAANSQVVNAMASTGSSSSAPDLGSALSQMQNLQNTLHGVPNPASMASVDHLLNLALNSASGAVTTMQSNLAAGNTAAATNALPQYVQGADAYNLAVMTLHRMGHAQGSEITPPDVPGGVVGDTPTTAPDGQGTPTPLPLPEPTRTTTNLHVADFTEQGQHLLAVVVNPKFGDLPLREQRYVDLQIQLCASSAGSDGAVVPVWTHDGSDFHSFAPENFAPFFQSINMEFIDLKLNKTLTCTF